jgi:hypothetical protein
VIASNAVAAIVTLAFVSLVVVLAIVIIRQWERWRKTG